jgi:hypothetical protein
LTVPSDWDLVLTRGAHPSGHVRLADQDAVRMQLRWQTARQLGPPSVTVDAYVARLKKDALKRGTDLAVHRDLKLGSPVGKEVECYGWTADGQIVAMLSHCAQCGRIVHVRLYGRRDEPLRGIARTVFASLADHPEDGTNLWSFFDLEFSSPADLPLAHASLMVGCVRMLFARGLTRLEFVRLSMARTALAGKEMAEWFRGFYGKSLKRRSYRVEAGRVKGHPGVTVEGRPWLALNPLRLLGRRRVVRAACWNCEKTNRLFICCFDGPEAQAQRLEPAVQGLRCCEEA